MAGYEIKFPPIEQENLLESFWNTRDIDLLNQALIDNVLNLKEINIKLAETGRKKAEAEANYKHKYRKLYLQQPNERTETWKKINSEINCESEEIKLNYYIELENEYTRKAQELRMRLETLKNISFNIREELRL